MKQELSGGQTMELRVSPETRVEVFYMEEVPQEVISVCEAIKKIGGTALIVGGSIRDAIISREHPDRKISPKDFDLEVYGVPAEKLDLFLSQHFGSESVLEVGKAFGIVKVKLDGFKEPLDFSLPRSESKKGEGHKGFETTSDPYMSIEEAARRRDITANSMAYDPLTHKLYDPFGGVQDIRNKIIRATDPEKFIEDPLRVLRVAQFLGRMEFSIEEGTAKLCAFLVETDELDINETGDEKAKGLSKERIAEELVKLVLKSEKPSIGFRFLKEIGYLKKYLPMVDILAETKQEKDWHPEGNVFEHTMQVMDSAAVICKAEIKAGRLLIAKDKEEIEEEVEKIKIKQTEIQTRRLLAEALWCLDEEKMHDLMREAGKYREKLMNERITSPLKNAKKYKNPFSGNRLISLEEEHRAAVTHQYWKWIDTELQLLKNEMLAKGVISMSELEEIYKVGRQRAIDKALYEKKVITENMIEEKSLVLILGALGHDLGKPETTAVIEGKITSYNHEAKGVPRMREMMTFFDKMRCAAAVRRQVLPLVAEHMKPPEIYRMVTGTLRKNGGGVPNEKGARKLLNKLTKRVALGDGYAGETSNYADGGGTSIYMLSLIAKADQLGRNPAGYPYKEEENKVDLTWFDWVMQANEQRVVVRETASFITGQEILDTLSLSNKEAGPWIKVIMKCIDLDNEDDIVESHEEAIKKVPDYYRRLNVFVNDQVGESKTKELEKGLWSKLISTDPRMCL